jgi:hypothetical protein
MDESDITRAYLEELTAITELEESIGRVVEAHRGEESAIARAFAQRVSVATENLLRTACPFFGR